MFKKNYRRLFALGGLLLVAYMSRDFWSGVFVSNSVCGSDMSYVSMFLVALTVEGPAELATASDEQLANILIDEMPSGLLDPAIRHESDTEIELHLPASFFYDPTGSCNDVLYREDSLACGRLIAKDFWEYRYLNRAKLIGNELARRNSDELVVWMVSRAETLPPGRIDAFCWWFFASKFTPEPEFWHSTRSAWRKMAAGPNPAYRLVARANAKLWAVDEDEFFEVAVMSLNEECSVFHELALRQLSSPIEYRPEMIDILEQFLDKPGLEGNDGTITELSGPVDVREIAQRLIDSYDELGGGVEQRRS